MNLDEAKALYAPEVRTARGIGRPSKELCEKLKVARAVLAANFLTPALTPMRRPKGQKSIVASVTVATASAGTPSRDEQIESFINSLDLRERNYIRETLGEMEVDEEAEDTALLEILPAPTPEPTPEPISAPAPVVYEDPTW